MSITELGAIGEILGALGVIASLIYLSVQIRQNTHAMDEGRRLALAQTYQMRADALQQMLVTAANSEIGTIIYKLTEDGYPEDVTALDSAARNGVAGPRSLYVTRGKKPKPKAADQARSALKSAPR